MRHNSSHFGSCSVCTTRANMLAIINYRHYFPCSFSFWPLYFLPEGGYLGSWNFRWVSQQLVRAICLHCPLMLQAEHSGHYKLRFCQAQPKLQPQLEAELALCLLWQHKLVRLQPGKVYISASFHPIKACKASPSLNWAWHSSAPAFTIFYQFPYPWRLSSLL